MVNFTDHGSVAEAADTGAGIFEFNAKDMTSERVAEARAVGFEIMMHTAEKDIAAFARAFDLGIDYLNIDFPEIAARMRAARQRGKPDRREAQAASTNARSGPVAPAPSPIGVSTKTARSSVPVA